MVSVTLLKQQQLGKTMNKEITGLSVLDMPEWKSKILNGVAWILGMRGEYVACITFNFDYRKPEVIEKIANSDACQDCVGSCSVCGDAK